MGAMRKNNREGPMAAIATIAVTLLAVGCGASAGTWTRRVLPFHLFQKLDVDVEQLGRMTSPLEETGIHA